MIIAFAILIANIISGSFLLWRFNERPSAPVYELQLAHTATPYLPTSLPHAAQPGRVLRANSSIYGPS